MYKIKKMDIKHYEEIITLWKNTEGVGLNEYDDSKKSIKKFIEKNPNTCFIAEINTEVIGTIMGGYDGRRGFIYHLMVKHEHRKHGIGKNLLEKVEIGLRREGVRRIYLVLIKENETGMRFWENNGYELRDFAELRSKKLFE